MSVVERWVVAGRVQGVGFRAWMAAAARRAGVRGHVRNLPDGTVEVIVVADDRQTLDRLAVAARVGPDTARVAAIDRSAHALVRPPPAAFEQR